MNDVLELLESPGNGRFGSYSNLKKRFNCSGVRKDFAFSAKRSCCIADTSSSVDAKREKSYKMFYERRISAIPKHWDEFHVALGLEGPDPVWTQTVNRLLFNQEIIASIKRDGLLEHRPVVVPRHDKASLGTDEENIIIYMAGYIPFKLLKVYKKKDSAEAADVVDFLSGMSQPGPEDDFYYYTQEWTKAISRGDVFEVSSDVFSFFLQLDVAMRKLLSKHLISGVINRDEVMDAVMKDEDVMFQWAMLSCQLSNEGNQTVLKQVIETLDGNSRPCFRKTIN